jgi:hypothetical protein
MNRDYSLKSQEQTKLFYNSGLLFMTRRLMQKLQALIDN